MSVITAHKLTKRYGARRGIDGLDLCVDEGSLFGFLGPNGSGKTTTIRLLLALLRPSSGQATVFGMDCWRNGHRIKADVGYVPGDLRLYSWMNARIALRILSKVRGRDLVDAGLDLGSRFDLDLDVTVSNMSRGMRQKLGLVMALVHDPKLLILDEPTSSLDPIMQQLLYKELRERAAKGSTVFFCSHTLGEVEALCDHVAILRKGVLVVNESLDALRARAKRAVSLRWCDGKAPATTDLPSFLQLNDKRGGQWQLSLTGPVMELVRWGATQPLDDMTIEQPDLEHVFKQFYEEESDA